MVINRNPILSSDSLSRYVCNASRIPFSLSGKSGKKDHTSYLDYLCPLIINVSINLWILKPLSRSQRFGKSINSHLTSSIVHICYTCLDTKCYQPTGQTTSLRNTILWCIYFIYIMLGPLRIFSQTTGHSDPNINLMEDVMKAIVSFFCTKSGLICFCNC